MSGATCSKRLKPFDLQIALYKGRQQRAAWPVCESDQNRCDDELLDRSGKDRCMLSTLAQLNYRAAFFAQLPLQGMQANSLDIIWGGAQNEAKKSRKAQEWS